MLSHHALPLSIANTPVPHAFLGRLPAHVHCFQDCKHKECIVFKTASPISDHWVMYVLQGEAFDFGTPVVIDGAVEVWMSAVEKEMRTTLHRSGMLMIVNASCMQHRVILSAMHLWLSS